MTPRALPLLLPLAPLLAGACAPEPTETAWIRAWSVDWAAFNHRLSYLALHPTTGGAEAAFVGGASTTGHVYDDAGTCIDADTCWELPFEDPSLVQAEVVRAVSEDVVLGGGAITVPVDGEANTLTLEVTLPRRAEGTAWAWIAGFTIDATTALRPGAASCYDPRHGWLPTRLGITVGRAALQGDGVTVRVPVSADFGSGLSLEEARACLDAVAADARAAVTVQVAVLVGPEAATVHTLGAQAAWPDRGDPQSVDVLGDLTTELDDAAVVGWTSWAFRFHDVVDAQEGRGAYLRTLQVEADPASDVAFGFASNTSPTALSGFDYRFDGELLELPVEDVALSAGTWGDDALPAALDGDFRPVVQALAPLD